MTLVTVAGTILAFVAELLAPWLTAYVLLPDAAPDQQALTASLMRVMLATVLIFGISGLIMGILNTYQHFLMPAIAPSMSNVGLIIGAVFLAPHFGVFGLAYGAVLGAILHLGVQIPALLQVRPQLRPRFDVNTPAVVQINFVVNTALASGMAPGSLTALTVAFTLMFTVLGVLGQSVGTAVFPSLAALSAQNDYDGFRRTLAGALRGVLFMSIPATIGLMVLAVPLIATINEHGRWSAQDTMAAAWALQFFAVGLVGFALQEILARAFYALYDTMTPVLIGVSGMILNVILSLILIQFVQGQSVPFGPMQNPLRSVNLWLPGAGQGPFGGLALANSLATLIESVVLWLLLRRRLNGLDDRQVLSVAGRALIAALVMGFVVYGIAHAIGNLPPVMVLIVGAAVGMISFELLALRLNIPEARSVPETVLRRFRRR
jgi:putative peptidoglycan lipid II flippase